MQSTPTISESRQLKLRVANSEIYRVLDEYKVNVIEETNDKTKTLILSVPDIYWIKSWILSFGASMQILEPERIRMEIQEEIRKLAENYKSTSS